MNSPELQIKNIRRTVENGFFRVCAEVDGVPVWYESPDTELLASPEVFANAFLVPALAAGATLCVEGKLSKVWKNNVRQLIELFHSWWGYPVITIDSGDAPEAPPEGGRTALFFTGGVDSFYSLLRGRQPVDDLIYVHGFDLPLSDDARFSEIQTHLEAVASASGKRLVTLKTNLREHPLIRALDWGRTHGGALASAAYCLPETARILISSSYSRRTSRPWGSHWESDPFWSSERLEVIHQGDHIFRNDKLRAIVDEPLVQRHLRVCWKNKSEHLNCCQCEKCVRTQLVLESCGKLDRYEVFSLREHLPISVGFVRYIPDGIIPTYQELIQSGLSRRTERAVRALLRRTSLRQLRCRITTGFMRKGSGE